jgi:hypothetical protein
MCAMPMAKKSMPMAAAPKPAKKIVFKKKK